MPTLKATPKQQAAWSKKDQLTLSLVPFFIFLT